MFFQGLLKVPSQRALWGALFQIFTDFWGFWDPHWAPIWHHFPSKSGIWNWIKKKLIFRGHGGGKGYPRVGMIRNWSYPKVNTPAARDWRGVSNCRWPSRHRAQLDYWIPCEPEWKLYCACGFVNRILQKTRRKCRPLFGFLPTLFGLSVV